MKFSFCDCKHGSKMSSSKLKRKELVDMSELMGDVAILTYEDRKPSKKVVHKTCERILKSKHGAQGVLSQLHADATEALLCGHIQGARRLSKEAFDLTQLLTLYCETEQSSLSLSSSSEELEVMTDAEVICHVSKAVPCKCLKQMKKKALLGQ